MSKHCSARCAARFQSASWKDKTLTQLDSEIMLGSIYDATPEAKVKAKRVILAHDATATDIIEILGLEGEVK